MCLSLEDFERRGAQLDELMAEGHMDIEAFMAVCGWDWGTLVSVGLVRLKRIQSTADHIAYEPTAAGRKYLKAYKADDILVIKRGQGAAMVLACQAA